MKVLYYPGCSSEHLARDFYLSIEALASLLSLELEPLPDWNCCGAREIEEAPEGVGLFLAARNLALASGKELLVTCSLCFHNLKRARNILRENPLWRSRIAELLKDEGLELSPDLPRILSLTEFLPRIDFSRFRSPHFRGFPVAVYYGCFLSRPYPTDLQALEKVLSAAGYPVIPTTLKTHCCGGHLPRTDSPVIKNLCRRLLFEARQKNASGLAVACPVCKLNLEIYGDPPFPVRYFTQYLGLALGISPSWLGIPEEE